MKLLELMKTGKVKSGNKVYATYKGHTLKATLRKSGDIKFGTQTYKSLSAAANAAKKSVETGPVGLTNGWTFWSLRNGTRMASLR